MVRISFSNMFKDFKSTPTSLQFPFLCGAAKDSVYESTAKSARHGKRHTYTHYLYAVVFNHLMCLQKVNCYFCVFKVNDLTFIATVLTVFMFMWLRFGGSSPDYGALDLSDAGSAVHTLCLPQPLLQLPEERQALCQHGSEKHVY